MTRILYIGRHPEILATVVRLINARENCSGMGAVSDAEAALLFAAHDFDMVLLGCGIEPESEHYLTALFSSQKPEIPIVQHYGGGGGLLNNEILATCP